MRSCRTLLALTLACLTISLQSGHSQSAPQISSTPAQTPPYPSGAETPLSVQITNLLSDPSVSQAHWGIAVTAMDGTPVFGLDEAKLFRPASTAKLFTTAVAMALLGPSHRFRTQVYGDLDAATGTVAGELTLLGGGDPEFGTNDLPYSKDKNHNLSSSDAANAAFAALADQMTRAGVKQIDGDVVGDDTLFEAGVPPEGWAEEDLLWGYGALPSALTVSDNQVRLTIEPKPAGTVPGHAPNWIGSIASVDQLFPYLRVNNEVIAEAKEGGPEHRIQIQGVPGQPLTIEALGAISPGAPKATEELALPDPAAYAAGALRAQLIQRGSRVDGQQAVRHSLPVAEPLSFVTAVRTPGCETSLWGGTVGCAYSCSGTPRSTHLLAEHVSRPLSEDVVFTLKTSANLHAEMLLHHIGLLVSCPGVTTLQGARVLHSWLLHLGIAEHDFMLYDGSGLSTKDLVTPRAEAQLLAYAATQPWFPLWKAGLPIGGVDGTLASRFTESPLKGRVFAKTGTLGESRALAGYVQCASGRELIFSIMVDDHEPGSSADRTTMDRIVEVIAANN